MNASEIKTGTDAIRARTWSRWRRGNLSITSRDLKIPLAALESFAQGTGKLSATALQALAGELFMNAKFDPVTDRLVDTKPPPTPTVFVMPPPYNPKTADPRFAPRDPKLPIQLGRVDTPQTTDCFKSRPGFA